MSNYDPNVAIPGAPVDQAFALDAGLRAHMLRVYNYMATGVGLTLQLPFCFEVHSLSGSLVSSAPE